MTAQIWERPYADRKAVQCLQNGTNTAKSQSEESESHISTGMSFTSLVLVAGGWRRKTGFERMHVQYHLYKAKNVKKILLLFTNTK